jgi:hypothetical protein
MAHPPRPDGQWLHQVPTGFSNSLTLSNLQQSEHESQLRPGTTRDESKSCWFPDGSASTPLTLFIGITHNATTQTEESQAVTDHPADDPMHEVLC